MLRSVRRSEKFVPFSSWEFYIFTQIDSARWLGDGYGETESQLFKLLRYLKGPSQPMCIARQDTIGGHFLFHRNSDLTRLKEKAYLSGQFCLPFECFNSI